MNKKVSVGALLTTVILAVALTVSVTMLLAIRYFNSTVSDVTQRQALFDYVTEVDRIVRYNYYGTIDEEKLRQALSEGYIDGIGDPYAAYLSAQEYQQALDAQKGRQTGFGLEIALSDNGRIVITRVHQDSTADKAGIQTGDILTAVNGDEISASDFTQVSQTLQEATKVILSVQRDTTSHAFEISTSTFETVSVEGRLIEGHIGFIRIYTIHDATPQQFSNVYEQLQQQGATRFIFDVRDNAGGSYTAVEELLAGLVPSGAYARQTDNTQKTTDLTSENDQVMTAPSVTLVNGTTAGEAELFAGVLQEMGMTTVIGEVTAGKGMIQQYFTNSDGSAIRLSVAERSLIQGGSVEGVGILPDEEVHLRGQLALTPEEDDAPLQAALRHLRETGGTTGTTVSSITSSTSSGQAVGSATTLPSKASGNSTAAPSTAKSSGPSVR